ncbi:cyclin-dependent kinase inhibitor 3 family protein [Deinococcus wulumuqiensis]|uniref:Protein-tyrosine-phosphatase n=1 Tax=Deinococcus wulumuqiensis TaxID=980427 RepID=A0AAV4K5F5_9DEIO|nr:cyclin-dependent kinase inhibitor 3 family protein [Deinococcus wulumuqiensis]QII19402.1 protein-tyrosine-phosphatase [Deinococcus wulumuqiensis R12]GGI76964.1 protein-tyrosine-phosphatase [Deinococcus wulumuqiensis]GGP29308.1 protein-tyrosine-phosphatase [Deinococcus wulumuqiensis]
MTSSPIRVDWIPTALWPGQLGLTFAPGKKGESLLQPGVVHRRSVEGDMQELARQGTNVIAPLIEEFEFEMLGMDGYHEKAEAHGLSISACPIVDGDVPSDPQRFGEFLDELMEGLLDGKNVVVHCRGGLGRAGLTAACLLVQAGMEPGEAMALVRKTRPGAIENSRQEKFVREFGGLGA